MGKLKILVETAQEFPIFTYTVDFVESLGRELNLAVTGQKDPKEALDLAAEELQQAREEGRLAEGVASWSAARRLPAVSRSPRASRRWRDGR